MVLASLTASVGCDRTENSVAPPTSQPSDTARRPQRYVLRPLGGDPSAVKFVHTKEPPRDWEIELKDGWRSLLLDKVTGLNIAYFASQDLDGPVENQVRNNADFFFELRWRVGDLASMNAALKRYGVEIVADTQAAPTTQVAP